MPWATEDGVGPVRWRVGEQAGIIQPPRQFGERDLRLQPGGWRAEAVMNAAAETQVLALPPAYIDALEVVPVGVELKPPRRPSAKVGPVHR